MSKNLKKSLRFTTSLAESRVYDGTKPDLTAFENHINALEALRAGETHFTARTKDGTVRRFTIDSLKGDGS